MQKIKLHVPRPAGNYTGVIRLDREAEDVIRELQYRTGLPASNIVSQIVRQAKDLIEIEREES